MKKTTLLYILTLLLAVGLSISLTYIFTKNIEEPISSNQAEDTTVLEENEKTEVEKKGQSHYSDKVSEDELLDMLQKNLDLFVENHTTSMEIAQVNVDPKEHEVVITRNHLKDDMIKMIKKRVKFTRQEDGSYTKTDISEKIEDYAPMVAEYETYTIYKPVDCNRLEKKTVQIPKSDTPEEDVLRELDLPVDINFVRTAYGTARIDWPQSLKTVPNVSDECNAYNLIEPTRATLLEFDHIDHVINSIDESNASFHNLFVFYGREDAKRN